MEVELDFGNDGNDKCSVALCQVSERGASKGFKLDFFADEGSKTVHRSSTEGPLVENFMC